MNIGCSIRINEKYFEIEILVSEIEFHSFISHCELFCEPYRNHFSELKSMGDPWQFSSPPPPLQMQFNQSRHKNCSILPGMTDISPSARVCVCTGVAASVLPYFLKPLQVGLSFISHTQHHHHHCRHHHLFCSHRSRRGFVVCRRNCGK